MHPIQFAANKVSRYIETSVSAPQLTCAEIALNKFRDMYRSNPQYTLFERHLMSLAQWKRVMVGLIDPPIKERGIGTDVQEGDDDPCDLSQFNSKP